jgi:hypothetical protein
MLERPLALDIVAGARRRQPTTADFQGFRRRVIRGVTKDSAGAALGGCDVHAFRTVDDVEVDQTISDGSGNYEISVYDDRQHYVVAYKAGSPDVTGATLNTVAGV